MQKREAFLHTVVGEKTFKKQFLVNNENNQAINWFISSKTKTVNDHQTATNRHFFTIMLVEAMLRFKKTFCEVIPY